MPNNFDDMFNDEFGFNPNEDLEADLVETEVDKAKLSIIAQMKEYIAKTEDAIRFHEPQNEEANFRILSRYLGQMIEVNSIVNDEQMSEEEKVDKIKEIEFTVTDMTFEAAANFGEDTKEETGLDIVDRYMKKKNDGSESDENSDNETDW